ncbi:hypothetical protein [Alloactinosynnema sp. L-07]|nr:hypothetical protein [Alloactinosynnema sp. L-07]
MFPWGSGLGMADSTPARRSTSTRQQALNAGLIRHPGILCPLR